MIRLKKRVGIHAKVSVRSALFIPSAKIAVIYRNLLALQRAKAQIVAIPQLFFNPQYAEVVDEMLEPIDETQSDFASSMKQ